VMRGRVPTALVVLVGSVAPCLSLVSLVGSGVGGVWSLTQQATDALRSCDALVFDALADDDAMRGLVPADAELHDVGKRGGDGRGKIKQDEIDALLVELAGRRQRICRLKAGDPYVFGRARSGAGLHRHHRPPPPPTTTIYATTTTTTAATTPPPLPRSRGGGAPGCWH